MEHVGVKGLEDMDGTAERGEVIPHLMRGKEGEGEGGEGRGRRGREGKRK